MPEPEAEIARHENQNAEPGALNDAQQRRLSITCKYIDKLLCDIEQRSSFAASQSPFPRYVVDLTPRRRG
jgi:hypothetical protein